MTLPIGSIICGDCLDVMRGWPADSVDCCVTSPPYCATIWAWRDLLKGNTGEHTSRFGIRRGLKSSTLRISGQRRTSRRSLAYATRRFSIGYTSTGFRRAPLKKPAPQNIGVFLVKRTPCTAETEQPTPTGTVAIRRSVRAHMHAARGRNSPRRFWRETDLSARNAGRPTTHSTNFRYTTLSRGANIHHLGLRRPI